MEDETNQEASLDETPEVEETPVTPVATDPALDCPDCLGLGLIDEQRCAKCLGTGKAQNNPQTFPDGTQVIRPDGTFNVVNGVEVKQE